MAQCLAPSASGSSLLHLRRPARLEQQTKPALQVVVQGQTVTSPVHSVSSSPTSIVSHTSTRFCPPRVDPCMKVDTDCPTSGYLQRPCPMRRSSSDGPETSTSSSFSTESSISLRRLVQQRPNVLQAKPKEEWQRDEDSALCNHPFCSTMFGQTSLPIGPRRHHCRMCGLIFCYSHSTGRLSLLSIDRRNRPVTSVQRVCDGCCGANDDSNADRRTSDTAPSLVHSEGGSSNEDIVSSPMSYRFPRNLSCTAVDESEEATLAPIEEWMDRSGILSLYPLAVQPSHSRRARSPSATTRAAGPLFAPTISERRSAKERELERLSLRQRSNVRLWITTPATSDVESEYEDEAKQFRFPKVSRSDGTRTPQERELDWSTF